MHPLKLRLGTERESSSILRDSFQGENACLLSKIEVGSIPTPSVNLRVDTAIKKLTP